MNDLLNRILNEELCVSCATANEIRLVKQTLSAALQLPHSEICDMVYPFVCCRNASKIVGVCRKNSPAISCQEFMDLLSEETTEDPPISCAELLL